jgi:hypothetical protein
MSTIRFVSAPTGEDVYALVRNCANGQIFNTDTPGFEAYNASNYADYAIACTEQGDSGTYAFTMPSVAAGVYDIEFRQVDDTAPAEGVDELLDGGVAEWMGSAFAAVADGKATGFAVAGDQMDLVDAPNATAVTAIQAGLSTFDPDTQPVGVGAFVEDALDAQAIKADAVTKIQDGLALEASVQDVYTDTQRVDGMIENSSGNRFTEKALEEAPSGGGGGGLDEAGVRAALGMATANMDDKQGEILAAIGNLDVGGGTGDYAVTVTVVDGDEEPVQGAVVTALYNRALAATGTTDASGEVVLLLNAGEYEVGARAGGFISNIIEHEVTVDTGTHEVTVALDTIVIQGSAPGLITVVVPCYGNDGAAAVGVAISLTLQDPGAPGGYSGRHRTVTTDGQGIAQFPDCFTSSRYTVSAIPAKGTLTIVTPASGDSYEVEDGFLI